MPDPPGDGHPVPDNPVPQSEPMQGVSQAQAPATPVVPAQHMPVHPVSKAHALPVSHAQQPASGAPAAAVHAPAVQPQQVMLPTQITPVVAAQLMSLLQTLASDPANPAAAPDAQQPAGAPGASTSAAGAAQGAAPPAAAPPAPVNAVPQQQRTSLRGKEPVPEEPAPAPVAWQAPTLGERMLHMFLNSEAVSSAEKLQAVEWMQNAIAGSGAAGPSNAAMSPVLRMPETLQHVSVPVAPAVSASPSAAPVRAPVVYAAPAAPVAAPVPVAVPHTPVVSVAAPVASPVAVAVSAAPALPAPVRATTSLAPVQAPVPVQQVAPAVPVVSQQYAPVPLSMQLAMSAPAMPAPVHNAPRLQFKLPAPEKFSGKVGGSILDVEVWGDDVKQFASSMGIPIRQALSMLTTHAARTHVSNMGKMPQCSTLPDARFLEHFVMHFKGQTKTRPEAARDKLFDGEVKQQTGQSVTEYHSIFNQVALDAHPIQELDLICWFKHGLLPEIREGLKPPSGQRAFSSLTEVVTSALLQEDFLKETNRSVKVPKLAAIQSMPSSDYRRFAPRTKQGDKRSHQWHEVKNQNKRRRSGDVSKHSPPTVWGGEIDKEMDDLRYRCWQERKCTNCQQKGCRIESCKEPRTTLGRWMDARRQKAKENKGASK